MKVGDLVVHKDTWDGYLFLIVEIDYERARAPMCRCTIVRSPKKDNGYEVGYTIRWKYLSEWILHKK